MESGSKNYPFRALEVSEGLDIPSINSLFDNSHKIEKTVDDLHNSSLSSDWARSLNLPQKYKVVPATEFKQEWNRERAHYEGESGELIEYAQGLLTALQQIRDEREKERRRLSSNLKEEVTEKVEEVRNKYHSTICQLKREKEDFESRVNQLNGVCSELSSKLGRLRREEEQLHSRADSRAFNTLQLLKSTREEADCLKDNLELINNESRKTIKQIQSLEREIEELRTELNRDQEDDAVAVGSKRGAEDDPERDISDVENISEADNEALEALKVRQLQLENSRLRTEIGHHQDIIERSRKQSVKQQLWDQHAEEIEELQQESADAKQQLQKELSLKTNAASMVRRLIGATITHATQNESHLVSSSPGSLASTCAWLWTLVEKNDGELSWSDALQELKSSSEVSEASRDLLVETGLLQYDSTTGLLTFPEEMNESVDEE
eukprot:gb/GECG01000301.1/.p1 GENE.gb/GECG01000301.1/~~gb/GECG01000301.1/.p1  ORF type:complete len:438 (+),score=94.74 gb/GECG01000301.1/:1-1314(+)